MGKNILIEEQDEVLRLIDQKELDEIEASAEEFDGFTGIRIVGRVQPEVKVNFADIQKEYEEKFRHLDENPKLVYSKYSISDLWEWFEQKLKEVSKISA